jgi:hypothetical protein
LPGPLKERLEEIVEKAPKSRIRSMNMSDGDVIALARVYAELEQVKSLDRLAARVDALRSGVEQLAEDVRQGR